MGHVYGMPEKRHPMLDMMEHMTSTPAGRYPNPANDRPVKPEKRKRRAPLWVVAATGATALFIGVGIGAADTGQASDRSTITDLEEQLTLSQEESASAATALDDAVKSHTEATATLSDERDTLADRVETLTRSVEELTQQVSDEPAKTSAEKKRADDAEAQAAASVASPEPAPAPAPAPANTHYQNCTAARAAGAAPVYAGDPGYGPHLDRDGDGVGCE